MNWLKLDKVTIFTGTDGNGNRYLSRFLKDYKEAFPGTDPNAGCQRCLDDYYQKLIKHISIMKTVKNESGFVLKEKYQNIPLRFGSKVLVNNSNMTVEYGRELLKRKNGEKLFDKIPEITSEKEDLTKLKRGELNARATKLGLDAKSYANIGEIAEAIEKAESANVEETAGEGTEEAEASETETETETTGETAGEGTE